MTVSSKFWTDARNARVFCRQEELPPYQELLRDTAEWLEPAIGQRWLDLGCGSGALSRVIWEKSHGQVETVIGVDVAAINEAAYAELRSALRPAPTPMCLRFVREDFSRGFAVWPGEQFDGVVSGLSLQYAESYSWNDGQWTEEAYDRLLTDVKRLLKPGAIFVFSVNVPNPSWGKLAWHSFAGTMGQRQPLYYLKKSWRMWHYGKWLTRESRRGRYHYLPLETIIAKLQGLGFADIQHRLSYAGQAYVIRCRRTSGGSQERPCIRGTPQVAPAGSRSRD